MKTYQYNGIMMYSSVIMLELTQNWMWLAVSVLWLLCFTIAFFLEDNV